MASVSCLRLCSCAVDACSMRAADARSALLPVVCARWLVFSCVTMFEMFSMALEI